jgi:hypothetical protein
LEYAYAILLFSIINHIQGIAQAHFILKNTF